MIDILVKNVIPCTMNSLLAIYLLSITMNKKIDLKKANVYLAAIFLITISIINFFYVVDSLRFFVSTISVVITCCILFRDSTNKTIASAIVSQIIVFIAELIFVLLLILFFGANGSMLLNEYYGSLLTVAVISIISILLIHLGPVKKIIANIFGMIAKLKLKYMTIIMLMAIIDVNILLSSVYHDIGIFNILIMNSLFMLVYLFIAYKSLKDKSSMIKMQAENKALLNNLEEYEKMLDYQRVANHENKNQLLVVRSLLKENENSDALNYVNEVLDDKKDDNDVLFGRAKKIPSGGLQGIVYQKMLVMNDKNIKPILDVSNSVKKFKLENLDTKLNYDICRIIGVFLDNAIEETEKLDEREIMLSMYEQNNDLVIEISNKFKNVPDLERLEEKGYSTKGKGHGYGLSLVNDIVNNNNQIINEKGITRNIFTQKLIIKMQFKN